MIGRFFRYVMDRLSLMRQTTIVNVVISAGPRQWHSAAEAVKILTDSGFIRKVAIEASGCEVRTAAIRRLTDQSLLAKIAIETDGAIDTHAAVDTLTDQDRLADVAITAKVAEIRQRAFRKLTSEMAITRVALEAKDYKQWTASPVTRLIAPPASVNVAVTPAPLKCEFFFEAHAVGSGLGVPSLEVVQNVIDNADRELELNGKLKTLCRHASPQFVFVRVMSDEEWKYFLNARVGHSNWSRWFGVNSGNRYNVIYYEK
ncbi:MAG: hypothetical protein WCI77_01805 [Candidatus Omnitrophota bacterium]